MHKQSPWPPPALCGSRERSAGKQAVGEEKE